MIYLDWPNLKKMWTFSHPFISRGGKLNGLTQETEESGQAQ